MNRRYLFPAALGALIARRGRGRTKAFCDRPDIKFTHICDVDQNVVMDGAYKITEDSAAEANNLVHREYRSHWSRPEGV